MPGAVDVSLDDVSAQSAVDRGGALQVDLTADADSAQTLRELGQVQGVGAVKLERYGDAMLAALSTNG